MTSAVLLGPGSVVGGELEARVASRIRSEHVVEVIAAGVDEKEHLASQASTPPPPPIASAPKKTALGGFTDPPTERGGAVTWKVQDRHVRLLTRLVSNESNVTDAVVRKAVEWNSWEYLRCYERALRSSKDMPEGTVSVGFDILDQLPRHAALVSSTIQSSTFNDCVVGTLIGQTINAAGPDGKGHVVYAFRFVPN